ncbi:MAG: molecular chaperone TorD family protein [Raoultibacter sp.]
MVVCDGLTIQDCAGVYEEFAKIFLNEPTDESIGQARAFLRMFQEDDPLSSERATEDALEGAALQQRYYDRFLVPSSKWYIPLSENSVKRACLTDAGWVFGPTTGPDSLHVLECYHAAHFDFRALRGFAPLVESVRADALVVEVTFMAYLRQHEAQSASGEDASRWNCFAQQFLAAHLGGWLGKVVTIMDSTENDFYFEVVCALARWVQSQTAENLNQETVS